MLNLQCDANSSNIPKESVSLSETALFLQKPHTTPPMYSIRSYLSIWIYLIVCLCNVYSQSGKSIGILIDDKAGGLNTFESLIRNEIDLLLQSKYDIRYQTLDGKGNPDLIQTYLDQLIQDESIDMVISVGLISSDLLLKKSNYPKPCIASTVISREIQQLPLTNEGASGTDNLTYIESPFSVQRDLELFHKIFPFQHLSIMFQGTSIESSPELEDFFTKILEGTGASFTLTPTSSDINQSLQAIPAEADAVYLGVLTNNDLNAWSTLIEGINEKKLPTFALLGRWVTEAGALASLSPNTSVNALARRIAINTSKILEGTNPAVLPVKLPSYFDDFVINLQTARKIGVYPSWEMMSKAFLLNVSSFPSERALSLKSAIFEALQTNLDLSIANKETQIVEKEIPLARAELLPQIDLNSTAFTVDANTSQNSFGAVAPFTWDGKVSLSQLVLAEPAFANITIQKLLHDSQGYIADQTKLDIILETSERYLNILRALGNLRIQNENIAVTKQNLDISRTKEKVGYSGPTDVYRWESELALNNIDLNDAQVNLQLTKYSLNQLLNRPLKETFEVVETEVTDSLFVIPRGQQILLERPDQIPLLEDFLVEVSHQNLPEIQQLDKGIAVQNRLFLSQRRAKYVPTLGLSGQTSATFLRLGQGERQALPPPFDEIIPTVNNVPTYNIGLGLNFPISQGGRRSVVVQQTQLELLKLDAQKADLINQLDLRVRSSLQKLGASSAEIRLSQKAFEASRKNFAIFQDYYKQGLANVTQLVDAQKASIQTEILALNAVYQFLLDYLTLQRSVGQYLFLLTEEELENFNRQLSEYLSQNEN